MAEVGFEMRCQAKDIATQWQGECGTAVFVIIDLPLRT